VREERKRSVRGENGEVGREKVEGKRKGREGERNLDPSDVPDRSARVT
jgi:hypothetical protein